MPNLKEVKNRITSVGSTQQITKAMKMVSASKLRQAQARAWQLRPYLEGMEDIFRGLLQVCETENPLMGRAPNPAAPLLLVPISSDKGLCGSFNSNVIKATLEEISKHQGQTQLLPLGRRSYEYFYRLKTPMTATYYQVFHSFHYHQVQEIAQHLIAKYLEGRASRVLLIYNRSKNVATQLLCTDTFLPLHVRKADEPLQVPRDYIYEPSQEDVLSTLIPLFLHTRLYSVLSESSAAEHAARMTAMDKASENADQLLKELRLTYNRTRQAMITREILEIVSGASALQEA